MLSKYSEKKNKCWDFPGGPLVKTPCFQCRRHGFDPCSGSEHPACHVVWPEEKKIIETSGKIFPASVEEIISFLFKRVNHSDG